RGLRALGPAVSPDGKHLVFTSRDALGTRLLKLELEAASFPVGAASSALQEILSPAGEAQRLAPSWFPDGESLLVLSHETGGGMESLRFEMRTGQIGPLVDGTPARGGDGVVNQNPPFSPDGRYILFDSNRTNVYALYAYDVVTQET